MNSISRRNNENSLLFQQLRHFAGLRARFPLVGITFSPPPLLPRPILFLPGGARDYIARVYAEIRANPIRHQYCRKISIGPLYTRGCWTLVPYIVPSGTICMVIPERRSVRVSCKVVAEVKGAILTKRQRNFGVSIVAIYLAELRGKWRQLREGMIMARGKIV